MTKYNTFEENTESSYRLLSLLITDRSKCVINVTRYHSDIDYMIIYSIFSHSFLLITLCILSQKIHGTIYLNINPQIGLPTPFEKANWSSHELHERTDHRINKKTHRSSKHIHHLERRKNGFQPVVNKMPRPQRTLMPTMFTHSKRYIDSHGHKISYQYSSTRNGQWYYSNTRRKYINTIPIVLTP